LPSTRDCSLSSPSCLKEKRRGKKKKQFQQEKEESNKRKLSINHPPFILLSLFLPSIQKKTTKNEKETRKEKDK